MTGVQTCALPIFCRLVKEMTEDTRERVYAPQPNIPTYKTTIPETKERRGSSRQKSTENNDRYGDKINKPIQPKKNVRKVYTAEAEPQPWNGNRITNAPDWANIRMSATDYIQKQLPMVEYDDPTIIQQPLYRQFNIDGINDYSKLTLETSYDKNQEVMAIKQNVGHELGWDTTILGILVPISFLKTLSHKLQQMSDIKLDTLISDIKLNKGILYECEIEKANAKFVFTMQSEVGPYGRERMVSVTRINRRKEDSIKIPWVHLPRLTSQVQQFLGEYELLPIDLRHS